MSPTKPSADLAGARPMHRLRALLQAVGRRTAGPRHLCIHLAPHQLRAVTRQGVRAIEGSAQQITYANPSGHWQAALDALRQLLSAAGSGGQPQAAAARLPLHISLSSRWSPLAMAPWSDVLLSEPAATRFLQTQLGALYGDAAFGWHIVADDAPYGRPRAICGIDSALLQALTALAAEYGHPCHAIEPALSAAQRWLPQDRAARITAAAHRAGAAPAAPAAPVASAAIAVIEPGRLTLAAATRSHVTALHTQPCGANWASDLPPAWQRWSLRMPELSAISRVAVINLAAPPASALPPPFELADTPYDAMPMAQRHAEAAA